MRRIPKGIVKLTPKWEQHGLYRLTATTWALPIPGKTAEDAKQQLAYVEMFAHPSELDPKVSVLDIAREMERRAAGDLFYWCQDHNYWPSGMIQFHWHRYHSSIDLWEPYWFNAPLPDQRTPAPKEYPMTWLVEGEYNDIHVARRVEADTAEHAVELMVDMCYRLMGSKAYLLNFTAARDISEPEPRDPAKEITK